MKKYEEIVNRKLVDLFETNNFVPQNLFRISYRFGVKWNFVFSIMFFTIKTKTTFSVRKRFQVSLYIFLIL